VRHFSGDKSGWSEDAEHAEQIERPETTDSTNQAVPVLDELEVTVEKYSDRTFAVYVNEELLCVTAYRKGANAVRELLERLWRENIILKEKVEAEIGAQEGGPRPS
jgi:hypothetical protein